MNNEIEIETKIENIRIKSGHYYDIKELKDKNSLDILIKSEGEAKIVNFVMSFASANSFQRSLYNIIKNKLHKPRQDE